MITLIKSSNAARYSKLYNDAEFLLKQEGIMTEHKIVDGVETDEINEITSLEEYFSYIKDLSRLKPEYYTMLPLDEDIFEIDLNTRTINVPATFAKNGISVQSDEIAEIVYFKCDRYFDAVDLSTRDILIQWESAAKDDEGKVIKGVSVPWTINYEIAPGYIIFGWPLSTKITSAPGTVKFSVRFYEFNTDLQQITYSLSTLVQTATIKPGFDYDLKEMLTDGSLVDDARDLILDRFENTIPVNADGVAADPEILGYLVRKGVNFELLQPNELFERQCLGIIDGFTTGTIELAVAAFSEDAGRLSYEWKRQELPQLEGETPQFVLIPSELKYIVTADDDRKTNKLYYEKISNDTYRVYDGIFKNDPSTPQENWVEIPTIYERVSAASVDSVGRYRVDIENRVNNAHGNTTSLICLVPAPEAPIIVDEDDQDEGRPTGDVAERATLVANNDYAVTLSVDAVSPEEAEGGKLTYQWYHIAPGASRTEATEIFDQEDANYGKESSLLIQGSADVVDHVAAGDGTYYVKIVNNLNKEINEITSSDCRVTHGASTPIVAIDRRVTEPDMYINDVRTTGISITAQIDDAFGESRTEEDSLTFQWFRYTPTGGVDAANLDRQHAEAGTYERDEDDLAMTEPSTDLNSLTYVPNMGGYFYYCEVVNTYNGTKATICSPFINVING